MLSPCLLEPAIKVSSQAITPLLLEPPCPCRASLPAPAKPAGQSRFLRGANPPHESKLQQRQQQRAARGAGQGQAHAADPEPVGAHLARLPRQQERERRASLRRAAARQERAERARVQPNKPVTDAKPERPERDSLVIALQAVGQLARRSA